MAFIRPYRPSDKEACGNICIATLPPSLSTAPDPRVQRLSPYVWTHQFTYLSPGTCHVLDDGSGNAVGYCIGCPDVHAMRDAYHRYVDDVLLKDDGVATTPHGEVEGGGGGEGGREFIMGPRVPWMVPFADAAVPPAAASAAAAAASENEDAAGEDAAGDGSNGSWQQQQQQQQQQKGAIMVTNPQALEQMAFRADLLLFPPSDDTVAAVTANAAAAAAAAAAAVPVSDTSSQRQQNRGQDEDQQKHPLLSTYRATMHIDILPPFQGRGWGRKLIDTFIESVTRETQAAAQAAAGRGDLGGISGDGGGRVLDCGSGVWIGVSPENRKVLSFYARMGFRLVMNDDAEGVVLVRDIVGGGGGVGPGVQK